MTQWKRKNSEKFSDTFLKLVHTTQSGSVRIEIKMRRNSIFFSLLVIFTIVNYVQSNLVNLNSSSTSENENLTSQLLTCDDDDGKCKEIHRDHLLLVHKFDVRSSSSFAADDHPYRYRLKHSSFVYGLLVTASENQLNQKCHKEIMQIYHGINRKDVWAMKSEFECRQLLTKCLKFEGRKCIAR